MKKNTLIGIIFIVLFLIASMIYIWQYGTNLWNFDNYSYEVNQKIETIQRLTLHLKYPGLVIMLGVTVLFWQKSVDNKSLILLGLLAAVVLFEVIYVNTLIRIYPTDVDTLDLELMSIYHGKVDNYFAYGKIPSILYLLGLTIYGYISTNYLRTIEKVVPLTLLIAYVLFYVSKLMLHFGYDAMEFFIERNAAFRAMIIDNAIITILTASVFTFAIMVLGAYWFSEKETI